MAGFVCHESGKLLFIVYVKSYLIDSVFCSSFFSISLCIYQMARRGVCDIE
jgi:hypothetical protein